MRFATMQTIAGEVPGKTTPSVLQGKDYAAAMETIYFIRLVVTHPRSETHSVPTLLTNAPTCGLSGVVAVAQKMKETPAIADLTETCVSEVLKFLRHVLASLQLVAHCEFNSVLWTPKEAKIHVNAPR